MESEQVAQRRQTVAIAAKAGMLGLNLSLRLDSLSLVFIVLAMLIDAAVFVGYPWAASAWPEAFGLPG